MDPKSSLVMVLCLHLSIAGASTYIVGSSPDYATIQAAIDVAQNGDTVVVPPGRYTENINFNGKAITVTGQDPSDWEIVCHTVINGSAGGSCVVFQQGETAASILEGVTLTGGTGTLMDNPYDTAGYASLSGDGGGGIFCQDSSPTIRHCHITGNGQGSTRGAGYTHYGGGIALLGNCRARITHCVITNNLARYYGGGLLIVDDGAQDTGSEIYHCAIADNEVYWPAELEESFEVDCRTARPVISHTIVYGAESEGLLISDLSRVTYSCLKAVYTPSDDDLSGIAAVDFAGVGGNIATSPWFTASSVNEFDISVTGYHIRAESPCIDAGDPAYTGDADETDLDGQRRVMGGRIDIGADEVTPYLVVAEPQAGDVLTCGSTRPVRWSGYTGAVDILFSPDGGTSWQTIAAAISETDSYLWQLPEAIDSSASLISVTSSVSDPTIVLVDSGLFTVRSDATGTEVTSAWPSLGGDYARAGTSTAEGLAEGAVAWEQETAGAVVSSVTIGFDGRIHAACEDGKLYTFDADGAVLWTLDVNAPLVSAPSIGPDGSLFVGSQDGKLRAIDPNGVLRWTYSTAEAVYASPAIAADGTVYAGSTDGILYALAADGSELWQFTTKGPGVIPTGAIFASASIGADGTVYVAGMYDPNLYALNGTDGSVKWTCNFELYPEDASDPDGAKTGGWPFTSPVIGSDGTIYQTLLHDSHLYAIEPAGGTILWATDLLDIADIETDDADADGWSEPALGPDGTIYVSLDDPYLRAVHPDGTIEWATKLGEVGAFTMTVDARGWVYAASDDGYVYVVDSDGLQIGRWETSGWPIYPVIAPDGTVVVGDSKDYSGLVAEIPNVIRALSIDSLQAPEAQ